MISPIQHLVVWSCVPVSEKQRLPRNFQVNNFHGSTEFWMLLLRVRCVSIGVVCVWKKSLFFPVVTSSTSNFKIRRASYNSKINNINITPRPINISSYFNREKAAGYYLDGKSVYWPPQDGRCHERNVMACHVPNPVWQRGNGTYPLYHGTSTSLLIT